MDRQDIERLASIKEVMITDADQLLYQRISAMQTSGVPQPQRAFMRELTDALLYRAGIYAAGAELPESSLITGFQTELIYMNVNDQFVYGHIEAHFRGIVKTLEDDEVRLKRLRLWMNLLEAIPLQDRVGLYPQRLSLRDQVGQWLRKRVILLESVLESKERWGDTKRRVEKKEAEKLRLDTTTPMLALFIRMLKEKGVFEDMPVRAVLRFFVTYFQTRRQADISAENLRRKYYEPDRRQIDLMATFLEDCSGKVKKFLVSEAIE